MAKSNNVIIYDEEYLGPGFFIINLENEGIIKFLKIYTMNNYGFPAFLLRVYEKNRKDNPSDEYGIIDFTFNELNDKDLFLIFKNLSFDLENQKIYTVDKTNQGRNNFNLSVLKNEVKLSFVKDIYGVRHSTDFIDICMGDNFTCEKYDAILEMYKNLSEVKSLKKNKKTVKQLLKVMS